MTVWAVEKVPSISYSTLQLYESSESFFGDDATLIRADVSWESLVQTHTEQVLQENASEEDPDTGPERPRSGKAKPQKRSTTDPDATMTTSSQSFPMEPSFKQHGTVDDQCGIVVDVEVTTGQAGEGKQLPDQLNKAVEVILEELRTKEKTVPALPSYPVK